MIHCNNKGHVIIDGSVLTVSSDLMNILMSFNEYLKKNTDPDGKEAFLIMLMEVMAEMYVNKEFSVEHINGKISPELFIANLEIIKEDVRFWFSVEDAKDKPFTLFLGGEEDGSEE